MTLLAASFTVLGAFLSIALCVGVVVLAVGYIIGVLRG